MLAARERRGLADHHLGPLAVRREDHTLREQVLHGIDARDLVEGARIDELDGEAVVAEEAPQLLRNAVACGLVLDQQAINLHFLARLLDAQHEVVQLQPFLPCVHEHDLGGLIAVLARIDVGQALASDDLL